jgi:transcriptional regulator with XRE-family HTH domain
LEVLARLLGFASPAQLAELHRTQISELLRGRQVPRLDSVVRLSGALGVEPAELLEGVRFEPAAQQGEYRIAQSKKPMT